MKILVLCKKFPFPLLDGESIAIYNQCKSFSQLDAEVMLLSMNTSKHFSDFQQYDNELAHFSKVHTVYIDNKIQYMDALLNLFSRKSYHIQRFIDPMFASKLIEIISTESFDVIQMESIFLTPYTEIIRKHYQGILVMRAHNIEFEIWNSLAEKANLIWIKWYLWIQAKRLKKFELSKINEVDLLVPVSEIDALKFEDLGCTVEILPIPIGIQISDYEFSSFEIGNKSPVKLGFLGSLDWLPNIRGLQWFLKEVWPRLSNKFSNIEFSIAGRNCPESLLELDQKDVIVFGEVKDAPAFLSNCDILIVPVFSGSGIRVKILEGMASGSVVLTTSLGLEGINATNGIEVLVANTEEEFIKAISMCLANKHMMKEIAKNARRFVEKHFDSSLLAKQQLQRYSKKLEEVGSVAQ